MKLRKIQLIGLILGLLLVLSVQTTSAAPKAQKNSGNVDASSDALAVKITGGQNIPSYQFWNVNDNDTKYKLQFDSIFEATDNNSDGAYDIGEDKKVPGASTALASLSWDFSEITTDEDGSIHFDMTSSDGVFQFKNHLYADAESQLKFDVVIDGYVFDNDEAMLVLVFKLIVNEDDDPEADQEGDTIDFGNGFFQSEETATAGDATIGVGLSNGNEAGKKIYLAYEHFTGRMIHDPTIGVGDIDSTDKTLEVWPPEISKGLLIFTSLVVTMIILIIPARVLIRRIN